ncbi:unnamed protein product [Dicrocoelium dendriticum]|nr:unnamed protein product [Dicrocoelium dendriticum]
MSSAGTHHTDGDVPLYFDEFACEEPDSKEDADDEAEPVDPSFLQLIDDLEGVDSNSPDLYSVLGIAKDASLAEIRAAYKRLSLILHPDRHSSLEFADSFTLSSTRAVAADAEAAFQRVSSAYAILSDPDKRAIYDAYGHEG